MIMDLFEWAEQRARTAIAPPVQRPSNVPAEALPAEFHAICAVLSRHRGADAAIRAEDIAKEADLWPDSSKEVRRTRVRSVIRVHFIDFPFPVLANTNGFFVAETAEEIEHYHKSLRSRIREIGLRIVVLKKQARAAGFPYLGRARWGAPAGKEVPPIA